MKNKPRDINKPINRWELDNLSIKEIMSKYPDKVVSLDQRNGATYLAMDTCTIIFNSNFPKVCSPERLKKQIKNNKYN
tara:strand:- start:72 stop:305 length:234 start_codon:yes stop_codon:yes gene_type:complete